ncbi:MAG: mandelate racemase/muconate lactonizing enzyme family protein [Phycisphaerae bacterium]|nr:mandelate racemase/muconate lactonizing enzyme family protein [Phycisphaerae bacterium]
MPRHHDTALSRRSVLRAAGLAAGGLALGPRFRPAVAAVLTGRKSTDIRIRAVHHDFENHRFRTPLKFGGSRMDYLAVLNVTVRVERPDGQSAEGFGSMPLGNVWSFPPRYVPPEQSLAAMKRFAEEVVRIARDCDDTGHALDLSRRMLPEQLQRARQVSTEMNLAHPMPKLCSLVVISALDAALHDAYGKVNGVNSYNALGKEFVHHDLSHDLDERFKGKYLDAYTLREPKGTMPLYHLIGALDPLSDADIKERLNDGLPETLPEWIERDGLTHLKIKMNGDDLRWDVDRVLSIDRVTGETQKRRGVQQWFYSIDFNERCPNVEYLLDFFARIREKNPRAFERIQYVEQPTDRDLLAHPENKMHAAAKIKPVVIDESLTDYESLLLAREQGYSGAALKACKGITEALLMAAGALEFKMFLTVQDLTCPGASFLESAELSARVPTVAAIEGNARQFCPDANKEWEKKYPELFIVKNGTVRTQGLTKPGLGH